MQVPDCLDIFAFTIITITSIVLKSPSSLLNRSPGPITASDRSGRGGKARVNDAKIRKVIAILEAYQGRPRLSRDLPDPLDMLIATVLSQNTNDKNSHRAFLNLKRNFPGWADVARAPVAGLRRTLKAGGMANVKARRIKEILREVNKRFGSYNLAGIRRWRTDRIVDELTQIKGIGPKTAACVCVFSLGRDLFPVDTHVHRLCGRLGLVSGSGSPEKTFGLMRGHIPEGEGYSFHTNLIRFGRKVCRTNHPACGDCPLFALCVYDKKTGRSLHASHADHSFMVLENVS